MPRDDITNRLLGSVVSFEFIGACILVAVAWGSMTARMEALAQEQVQQENTHTNRLLKMEEVVRSRGTKISEIERDVAVVKNDLKHVRKMTEKTEQQVEEILQILRAGNNNHSHDERN